MTELVSVIIPTYKRSDMLPRAIESILNQTYSNVEVVVVDDNGTNNPWRDRVEELMETYKDDYRVTYIQYQENRNGAYARNRGIKEAKGSIITFLDDDDTYRPEKIQRQVEYLLKNPQHKAVYCGWQRQKVVTPSQEGDLSYNLLSGDHIIYTNAIMMWKENALNFGGFDENLRRHQEAVFLLRYFATGETIGAVSECLIDFDISDRQNAARTGRMFEEETETYLERSQSFLDRIAKQSPKLAKQAIVHRYRSMFLSYLKYGDPLGAVSFYFRKGLKFPIEFIGALGVYTIGRLKG